MKFGVSLDEENSFYAFECRQTVIKSNELALLDIAEIFTWDFGGQKLQHSDFKLKANHNLTLYTERDPDTFSSFKEACKTFFGEIAYSLFDVKNPTKEAGVIIRAIEDRFEGLNALRKLIGIIK
jgi:hypothetical protein